MVDDAQWMQSKGVLNKHTNEVHWAIVLGNTGDWQWLHKSGSLARSYNNVPKKPNAVCTGICHLCRGGQPGYRFEELDTRNPALLSTLHEQNPLIQGAQCVDWFAAHARDCSIDFSFRFVAQLAPWSWEIVYCIGFGSC